MRVLRAAGIEPVHYKGAALADLYPQAALRPYGDFDITVWPHQKAAAESLLRASGGLAQCDIKDIFDDLPSGGYQEVYGRTRTRLIAGEQLRVLGHEDHLRLACRHFQRHGGRRALWLCDVALLLETRPADFDWAYLLRGPRHEREGVICVLGLAHSLLDARLEDTPVWPRATALPSGLVSSVLHACTHPLSLEAASLRRQPHEPLWSLLRRRWFTPLHTAWRFNLSPWSPLVYPLRVARFLRHFLPVRRRWPFPAR